MNDATLQAFRQIATDMGIAVDAPLPRTQTRRTYFGLLTGPRMVAPATLVFKERGWTPVAAKILSGPNTGKYGVEMPSGRLVVDDTEQGAIDLAADALRSIGYR